MQIAVELTLVHSCHMFEKEYGNGEGLCNQFLEDLMFYSSDSDNCTVMAFDNSLPNPNFKLTSDTVSISMMVKLGSIVIPLLMFLVNAAAI